MWIEVIKSSDVLLLSTFAFPVTMSITRFSQQTIRHGMIWPNFHTDIASIQVAEKIGQCHKGQNPAINFLIDPERSLTAAPESSISTRDTLPIPPCSTVKSLLSSPGG